MSNTLYTINNRACKSCAETRNKLILGRDVNGGMEGFSDAMKQCSLSSKSESVEESLGSFLQVKNSHTWVGVKGSCDGMNAVTVFKGIDRCSDEYEFDATNNPNLFKCLSWISNTEESVNFHDDATYEYLEVKFHSEFIKFNYLVNSCGNERRRRLMQIGSKENSS